MNIQSFVPVVLTLLFATFGWRITREISLDDQGRQTRLLIGDYLNFFSMVGVLVFCIIIPLATGTFSVSSRITLAVAFVLIVFYPIVLAGHYRLFSKKGRTIYKNDVPPVSDQEYVLLGIAITCAAVAGWYVSH